MTGADDGSAVVSVGEAIVRLTRDELDRLLEALARLEQRDAEAVLEEIRALRLLGGTIRLLPSEAELASLEAALAGLAGKSPRRETIPVDTAGVDGAATGRGRR